MIPLEMKQGESSIANTRRSTALRYWRYLRIGAVHLDVRDGLTREERVDLYVLNETQKERGDRAPESEG